MSNTLPRRKPGRVSGFPVAASVVLVWHGYQQERAFSPLRTARPASRHWAKPPTIDAVERCIMINAELCMLRVRPWIVAMPSGTSAARSASDMAETLAARVDIVARRALAASRCAAVGWRFVFMVWGCGVLEIQADNRIFFNFGDVFGLKPDNGI